MPREISVYNDALPPHLVEKARAETFKREREKLIDANPLPAGAAAATNHHPAPPAQTSEKAPIYLGCLDKKQLRAATKLVKAFQLEGLKPREKNTAPNWNIPIPQTGDPEIQHTMEAVIEKWCSLKLITKINDATTGETRLVPADIAGVNFGAVLGRFGQHPIPTFPNALHLAFDYVGTDNLDSKNPIPDQIEITLHDDDDDIFASRIAVTSNRYSDTKWDENTKNDIASFFENTRVHCAIERLSDINPFEKRKEAPAYDPLSQEIALTKATVKKRASDGSEVTTTQFELTYKLNENGKRETITYGGSTNPVKNIAAAGTIGKKYNDLKNPQITETEKTKILNWAKEQIHQHELNKQEASPQADITYNWRNTLRKAILDQSSTKKTADTNIINENETASPLSEYFKKQCQILKEIDPETSVVVQTEFERQHIQARKEKFIFSTQLKQKVTDQHRLYKLTPAPICQTQYLIKINAETKKFDVSYKKNAEEKKIISIDSVKDNDNVVTLRATFDNQALAEISENNPIRAAKKKYKALLTTTIDYILSNQSIRNPLQLFEKDSNGHYKHISLFGEDATQAASKTKKWISFFLPDDDKHIFLSELSKLEKKYSQEKSKTFYNKVMKKFYSKTGLKTDKDKTQFTQELMEKSVKDTFLSLNNTVISSYQKNASNQIHSITLTLSEQGKTGEEISITINEGNAMHLADSFVNKLLEKSEQHEQAINSKTNNRAPSLRLEINKTEKEQLWKFYKRSKKEVTPPSATEPAVTADPEPVPYSGPQKLYR